MSLKRITSIQILDICYYYVWFGLIDITTNNSKYETNEFYILLISKIELFFFLNNLNRMKTVTQKHIFMYLWVVHIKKKKKNSPISSIIIATNNTTYILFTYIWKL